MKEEAPRPVGQTPPDGGPSFRDERCGVFGKAQGARGMRHRHRHGWRDGTAGGKLSAAPSLNDMAPGTTCRIKRLLGQGAIRQRLLDMGFVPGAEVAVIRSAPLRDPIEVRIGGSFVTVRREEAARIEVTDV